MRQHNRQLVGVLWITRQSDDRMSIVQKRFTRQEGLGMERKPDRRVRRTRAQLRQGLAQLMGELLT